MVPLIHLRVLKLLIGCFREVCHEGLGNVSSETKGMTVVIYARLLPNHFGTTVRFASITKFVPASASLAPASDGQEDQKIFIAAISLNFDCISGQGYWTIQRVNHTSKLIFGGWQTKTNSGSDTTGVSQRCQRL